MRKKHYWCKRNYIMYYAYWLHNCCWRYRVNIQINKQALIGYLRIGCISTYMVFVYLLKIYSVQYLWNYENFVKCLLIFITRIKSCKIFKIYRKKSRRSISKQYVPFLHTDGQTSVKQNSHKWFFTGQK